MGKQRKPSRCFAFAENCRFVRRFHRDTVFGQSEVTSAPHLLSYKNSSLFDRTMRIELCQADLIASRIPSFFGRGIFLYKKRGKTFTFRCIMPYVRRFWQYREQGVSVHSEHGRAALERTANVCLSGCRFSRYTKKRPLNQDLAKKQISAKHG